MKRVAVYAGTFDPITNGHIDILERALKVFERVHVAVAGSTSKKVLFPVEERAAMIREAVSGCKGGERVNVSGFTGLLVDHVQQLGAGVIIRGLRAVADYEYEAQMALINRHLAQSIETVFFVTSEHCSFISSSIVKEIARNGGDVTSLVPKNVALQLQKVTVA